MKMNSILLAVCCGALAVVAGCAAPGVPQPPSLRLPQTVDNLSAIRKGDRVILSWTPPGETTDHQTMRWPTTTRICRVLNQYPTNVCGEVVKEIKSSELVSSAPGARKPLVSYEDVLPPALIAAPNAAQNAAQNGTRNATQNATQNASPNQTQNQATYTIEVVNQRGHSAGLSNQVRIPLVATPPPPSDFRATLDAQGPLLQWNVVTVPAPLQDVSYRLRIYRRAATGGAATGAKGNKDFVLNSEFPYQFGRGEARDRNFDWEQEYDYKIASVTVVGRTGAEVEGDDSAEVHLMVHDVFPPAVPSGLQAVFSSVGQKPFIDLTWAPNTESDLAGYIVYRRSAASTFAVVSTAPVRAPAWRDNDVRPGQTYYYTVSAIDVRGNQSAQSAAAEETVPMEVR